MKKVCGFIVATLFLCGVCFAGEGTCGIGGMEGMVIDIPAKAQAESAPADSKKKKARKTKAKKSKKAQAAKEAKDAIKDSQEAMPAK